MMEIKITLEAPGLTAAMNNLADALCKRPVSVEKAVDALTHPQPENPAAATVAAPVTAPVENPATAPAAAPVTGAVSGGTPVNTSAPAPVNDAATAPVPSATSDPQPRAYTFEDITKAGGSLMNAGKMAELSGLLQRFGVQAVTQLKPEQYGAVMEGLFKLGATL